MWVLNLYRNKYPKCTVCSFIPLNDQLPAQPDLACLLCLSGAHVELALHVHLVGVLRHLGQLGTYERPYSHLEKIFRGLIFCDDWGRLGVETGAPT